MPHSVSKSDAVQWIERNLIAISPIRGPVPLDLYPFQRTIVDGFFSKSRIISDTPLSKYLFDKDDSRQVVFRLSKQPRQMGKPGPAQRLRR